MSGKLFNSIEATYVCVFQKEQLLSEGVTQEAVQQPSKILRAPEKPPKPGNVLQIKER